MSKPWVGEAELTQALSLLAGYRPPAASQVKKATQVALKYQNEYKMVVFELEKYLKRSSADDKLAGIFVMDAICRSPQTREKDVFGPRFASRMKQICACLHDMPRADKLAFSSIVDEWRRRGTFSATSLPSEGDFPPAPAGSDGPAVGAGSSTAAFLLQSSEGDPFVPASSYSYSSSLSSSLSASLSSSSAIATVATTTLAAAAAADEATTKAAAVRKPGQDKRKTVKLCPFREGSCPYAEKCRFAHDQHATWQESIGCKADKKRPLGVSASTASGGKTLIFGQNDALEKPKGRDVANPAFQLKEYPATHVEAQQQDLQKLKFARTKLDCTASIGSVAFSKVPSYLFQHLVAGGSSKK